MYDNGYVDKVQDLELVIEQERLVRPFSEIKELIRKNGAVGNKLLESVLRSKKDYIVDFIVLEEPEPELVVNFNPFRSMRGSSLIYASEILRDFTSFRRNQFSKY